VDPRPIGVFDSGVGGLTVLHALESAVPGEALVYLGDTARVPYGSTSAETVIRYSIEAAHFLKRHDVKLLVVACNTASSVALDAVAHEAGVPVLGVILPGARRAAEKTRGGRIGVIGTRATIGSEAYPHAIRTLRPDAHVLSRPCPLFVPLAEEGWTDNDVARQVAERYLAPFRSDEVDTLVLGCTHYPLLRDVIAGVMGPEVQLVDSAGSVAAEVAAWLAAHPTHAAPAGRDRARAGHFFVTDVPTPFAAVAERFLGRPIDRLERAKIEGE
jgi:glutamate racemase